MFLKRSD